MDENNIRKKTMKEGVPTEQEGFPTKLEPQETAIEKETVTSQEPCIPRSLSSFRDYVVVDCLPTSGGEADIFVIKRNGEEERILKLYRYGLEPKREALEKMSALSLKNPADFVRILETGYDTESKRWYELQERITGGTLRALIENMHQKNIAMGSSKREELLRAVLEQISRSLNVLHEENILHLDLKPENILVRSKNNLDLVLADFGTASTIDPDILFRLSKTVRGTPMYQSPESLIGKTGKPSDWWGLGMISLEVLTGENPFAGLPMEQVRSFMATNSPEIPEKLPEESERILKGLLTRDMEKRWGYDQVTRWLAGENGIPVHFEQSVFMEESKKGFDFMGRNCRNLAELAEACVMDEESWKRGSEHLTRGNIRRWLENVKNEYDLSLGLDKMIQDVHDPDDAMFRFVTVHGQQSGPVLLGKKLTLENLHLFAGKSAKTKKVPAAERRIVERLKDGSLRPLFEYRAKIKGRDKDLSCLMLVADFLKGKSDSEAFEALDVIIRPAGWHLPFLAPDATAESRVRALQEMGESGKKPWSANRWKQFIAQYVCPGEILSSCKKSPKEYAASLSLLEDLERRGIVLPVKTLSGASEERLSTVGSVHEYEAEVYRLWGYDEEIETFLSSLPKMLNDGEKEGKSFVAARKRLFAAYSSPFLKRGRRIESEDRVLLLSIRNELSNERVDWRSALRNDAPEDPAGRAIARMSADAALFNENKRTIREYEHIRDESKKLLEEQQENAQRERSERTRGLIFFIFFIACIVLVVVYRAAILHAIWEFIYYIFYGIWKIFAYIFGYLFPEAVIFIIKSIGKIFIYILDIIW